MGLALKKRFLEKLPRPQSPYISGLVNVALLVDSSSYEVYRSGDFFHSKLSLDGKHKMYSRKKEVAVMSSAPYYALFLRKSETEVVHDFKC